MTIVFLLLKILDKVGSSMLLSVGFIHLHASGMFFLRGTPDFLMDLSGSCVELGGIPEGGVVKFFEDFLARPSKHELT